MERLQYSGARVEKAGKQIRNHKSLTAEEYDETLNVVSYWRQVHETPLSHAIELLQTITKSIDKHAIFARRMKRTESIITKLDRFKTMSLYKMQDIGGCRAIIQDKKKLNAILRSLKKRPEFLISNGSPKVSDYIAKPKSDGYRSIHIIGKFPDKDNKLRSIEVQLRTPIQHSWATAVEIVDLFTQQSLKTNQGDSKWKELFFEVSKQFELMDNIQFFPSFTLQAKYDSFCKMISKNQGSAISDSDTKEFRDFRLCYDIIKELDVIELLNRFAQSLHWVEEDLKVTENNGYVLIVVDPEKENMSATVFSIDDSEKAEAAYIEEEKISSKGDLVVAMVATPNIGELKLAYPNYFADSSKFLEYVSVISIVFQDLRKASHLTLTL